MTEPRKPLTIEGMMADMRKMGVFDRSERRISENEERARQIFGSKISATEAAMKLNLTESLYGGPSASTDPRFAPLTAAQAARHEGFYWVRDRQLDGTFADWRVDEWLNGYWATHGCEETWRQEPDEIGPIVEPPSAPR